MSDFLQSRTPNQFARRMPRRRSAGGLQDENRLPLRKQLVRQLLCLFIAFVIIFPMLWIVSLSLDPRDISRPTEFRLIPPGASFDAYKRVFDQPTANPVKFSELARNSLLLASKRRPVCDRGGHPGGVFLLAFRVQGAQGHHVQRRDGADVTNHCHHRAVVRHAESSTDQHRRHSVQLAQLAAGCGDRPDRRPTALCDLEPEGLPGHDPARVGRGRPHRRRQPEPVVYPRSCCRWHCPPSP